MQKPHLKGFLSEFPLGFLERWSHGIGCSRCGSCASLLHTQSLHTSNTTTETLLLCSELPRRFLGSGCGNGCVWNEEVQRESSDMGQEIRLPADFSSAGKQCYFASWQKNPGFPFPRQCSLLFVCCSCPCQACSSRSHTGTTSWSLQGVWSSLKERESSSDHSHLWGCHRNPRAF